MLGSGEGRHSAHMEQLSALLILLALNGSANAAEGQKIRECFSALETREKVVSEKLVEPFPLMKNAARTASAEAIGAKLCRWSNDYVYEISLLRRDGQVFHVFKNAANGETMGSRNQR